MNVIIHSAEVWAYRQVILEFKVEPDNVIQSLFTLPVKKILKFCTGLEAYPHNRLGTPDHN